MTIAARTSELYTLSIESVKCDIIVASSSWNLSNMDFSAALNVSWGLIAFKTIFPSCFWDINWSFRLKFLFPCSIWCFFPCYIGLFCKCWITLTTRKVIKFSMLPPPWPKSSFVTKHFKTCGVGRIRRNCAFIILAITPDFVQIDLKEGRIHCHCRP